MKTLPKEGLHAPPGKGSGAAPQPRRRTKIFDSTLGFPGEGPAHTWGTTQRRPRVLRGHSSNQKVISLPSQAVSMFVRPRTDAPLTHGLLGPAMSHLPCAARRLFPSTQHKDHMSPLDEGSEISPMTGGLISPTTPSEDQPGSSPLQQPPAGDQIISSAIPLDITAEQTPVPTTKTTNSRKRKKTTLRADRLGLPNAVPAPAQTNVTIPTETDSERKSFIKKFGAEKGLTVPVLESIWQARKHGYHKPYDAPFSRFRAFFNETRPLCPFRPDTFQPGDVIGFLRQMQEEGSNHGSIKDASASISTVVSEATDGAINIGKKESVIAFLKSVRIH